MYHIIIIIRKRMDNLENMMLAAGLAACIRFPELATFIMDQKEVETLKKIPTSHNFKGESLEMSSWRDPFDLHYFQAYSP